MLIFVECPICKHKIIVGFNGKLYGENENLKDIRNHYRSHTIGEFLDYIEGDMLNQLLIQATQLNNSKEKVAP